MEELTISKSAILPVEATAVEMRTDAVRFPRLHTIPRDQAVRTMEEIVLSASVYRGTHPTPQDVHFTAGALVDELMADTRLGLRYISFAEIRRAVRTAVLETEMYGVNVASLYRAIVAYARGEGQSAREQAAQVRNRQTAPQVAIDAAAAALVKQHTNR